MRAMPDNKKKRKGRRAYLDDFQTTVSGEYIYCGAHYTFRGTAGQKKCFLQRLAALSAAAMVFSVLSGCVPAPGTLDCFYVLLPMLGSILSAVSILWAAVRLISGGEQIREYVYKATVEQFPVRTALCIGCAGLSLLGELLFLILNGTEGRGAGLAIFLFSQALVLASALLCRKTVDSVNWERGEGGQMKDTD